MFSFRRQLRHWGVLVFIAAVPCGWAQAPAAKPATASEPAAVPAPSTATAENPPAKPRRNVVVKITPDDKEVSALIPLQSLAYAEAEPFCRPLLSPDGTMGYMPERGSIIVFDRQRNVNRIRELIKTMDRPAVNIRVDIDFIGTGSEAQDSLDVRLRNRNDPDVRNNLVFKDGKWVRPNDIRINAARNRGQTTRNTSQFIMTMSGRPASLWVGSTIPDPSWLNNVRFIPTVIVMPPGGPTVIIPGNDPEWVWRDVGSRLSVLPRYLDNGLIDVEIFPEVTYVDGEGRNQAIRVESVSTRLTVRDGQRIAIGGVIDDHREFYTRLFGPRLLDRDDRTSVLDMYLTCRVMIPRDPAAGARDLPNSENPWRSRH